MSEDVADEITHLKPGLTGYRDHACRCPECYEAGQAYLAKRRARERVRRKRGRVSPDVSHGLTGYRNHSCRCGVCMEAGKKFNSERRREAVTAVQSGAVDWSALEHLKPGHSIQKRRKGTP